MRSGEAMCKRSGAAFLPLAGGGRHRQAAVSPPLQATPNTLDSARKLHPPQNSELDGSTKAKLLISGRTSSAATGAPSQPAAPQLTPPAASHHRWDSSKTQEATADAMQLAQTAGGSSSDDTMVSQAPNPAVAAAPQAPAAQPESQPQEPLPQPAWRPERQASVRSECPIPCSRPWETLRTSSSFSEAARSPSWPSLRQQYLHHNVRRQRSLAAAEAAAPAIPPVRSASRTSRHERDLQHVWGELVAPPEAHQSRHQRGSSSSSSNGGGGSAEKAAALAAARAQLAAAHQLAAQQAQQLAHNARELERLHERLPAARHRLLDAQARLQAAKARLMDARREEEEAQHVQAALASLQRRLPRARKAAAAALRSARHALESEEREAAVAERHLQEAEEVAEVWQKHYNHAVCEHRPRPRPRPAQRSRVVWMARVPFLENVENALAGAVIYRSPRP